MTLLEMLKKAKNMYDQGGNGVYDAKAFMGAAIRCISMGYSPDCDYDLIIKKHPDLSELPSVPRWTIVTSEPVVSIQSEPLPEPSVESLVDHPPIVMSEEPAVVESLPEEVTPDETPEQVSQKPEPPPMKKSHKRGRAKK